MHPDLIGAVWRKSTRSGGNGGACVELTYVNESAGVRDSKNTAGGALVVSKQHLASFLTSVKNGKFDND